ncbi:Planctomycete cytochrome C [Rosistilla carotiformis]|uniref:Planctomycete cytochrome C n=1 Tax=Rosistilla carotiformis TaxID=2528017 RepID=A0A518JTG2_9BACT|nr:Planctomycete cytochrome C [Rosistilla carotiformis]
MRSLNARLPPGKPVIRYFTQLVACCSILSVADAAEQPIDFGRAIRPILADKCFACHGPDPEHREADLRLDIAPPADSSTIVPGKPEESELVARILSADPDLQMPPAGTGKPLTDQEIELLQHWIAEGAQYQQHWAFVPPTRPTVPFAIDRAKPSTTETSADTQVTTSETLRNWIRNPIDAFVLQRLKKEGIVPSPEADRVTWLRRLSLDLIGLPPTIAEVDAFAADRSPDAFDTQIERLLNSPHFGERWGRIWLDAARYADSNGYEKDAPRQMWFYRDWVVDALNRNMPYDDFIVQQIAGDLIPDATQANLVATGFLRNSMVNEEGGADPEQFRMEGMFDRMDAIGKSVLGLTTQCAQCHTHKYDPLTHEGYYRMFAFLNNTYDAIIPVYTPEEQQRIDSIEAEIAAIETELKDSMPDWREQLQAWAADSQKSVGDWQVLTPSDIPYEGQKFRVLDDSSIVSESYAPANSAPQFGMTTTAEKISAIRVELLTHPQLPRRGPGRSVRGTAALTEMTVYVAPLDQPEKRTKVKIVSATADVNPAEAPQPDYLINIRAKGGDKRVTGPIAYAIDGDKKTAWSTDLDPGRRNQPRKAVFVFEQPVGFPQGTVLTIQPEMRHGGWNSDDNHNCLMGRYRFSLTTDAAPVADPVPHAVREILANSPDFDTPEQLAAVFSYWRTTVVDWADANAKIEALWKSYPEGSNQLVLEQRLAKRTTSILDRGDFLSPKQVVEPGVPEFLHPLDPSAPPTRMTFARWLVDKRSPTTARSIVNRIWQAYFGIGLVETSDDFGLQSAPPSHRELLDWLAVELMENDWQLKSIHRLIVSSATYRQSSNVSPSGVVASKSSSYEEDPYNRLLARGPRFRVDAEIVRDITLSASGLLNTQLGGPSVYPPAPGLLFQPPASYGPKTWNEATGEDRYRRGLYTFRFRSVPYPMLDAFDADPGNVSCVRRNRSNTPLQALTLLNEPLSMECAIALAKRIVKSEQADDASRLRFAFRTCVARQPTTNELQTLQNLLDKQRQRIASDEVDAAKIVQSPEAASDDVDQLAAWTLVSRVLLSLDETMTKE